MVQLPRRNLRQGEPQDAGRADSERDLEAGLPWGWSCWVQDLGSPPFVVDATLGGGPSPGVAEAACLEPQLLEVRLPRSAKPGALTVAEGPHGAVEVLLPDDHRPGEKARLRLAAPPEMRVQVPEGGKPGDALQIVRVDRVRISACVPKGVKGGGFFELSAPAFVVAVPEGSRPGDAVTFREPAPTGRHRWLQAQCPKELLYGRYFAARPPAPE